MLNKIFTTVLLTVSLAFSQSNYLIQPSGYFTYGKYSDKTISNQYSIFLGGSFGYNNYFVVGYDNIKVSNDVWKYDQENYSFGFHYWILDLKTKLKFDFVSIKGKYSDNTTNRPLSDNGTLISPEVSFGVYPFYYGIGYSAFSQKGLNKINSSQIYLRADYYPHHKFLITLIPSFHLISDNSKYLSLQTSITYFPIYELSLNSTFSVGARKFYYNPDLMVLFNQIDTQTGNYSFRVNYNFYKNFVASLIYQKSKFTNYEIDYFVIGLKAPFYF